MGDRRGFIGAIVASALAWLGRQGIVPPSPRPEIGIAEAGSYAEFFKSRCVDGETSHRYRAFGELFARDATVNEFRAVVGLPPHPDATIGEHPVNAPR